MIRHLINLARSTIHENSARKRSPKWRAVEQAHLRAAPTCAACGGIARVQVHHVKPFHLDPALELEPTNLITLCMGTRECHLMIGHGDNFRSYNPRVVLDSATVLRQPNLFAAIADAAKKCANHLAIGQ